MTTRLVPRAVAPKLAIRLRKEIIAEKGDWLLIMPDDSIETMPHTVVQHLYSINDTSPTKPAGGRSHVVRVAPKSLIATINGKRVMVGAQLVRVLAAAAQHKSHFISSDIDTSGMSPADADQISGRLTDASRLGLVIRTDRIGGGPGKSWSLTNEGREIVRQLGEQAQNFITRKEPSPL